MNDYESKYLVDLLIKHLENKQEKECIHLLDKHPFLLNHSLAVQRPTVFHYAALFENYAVIDYLVFEKQINIHQIDDDGENAMFYAMCGTESQSGNMMKKLYDVGVSINHIDKYGYSLLMMSAESDLVESSKFLIEHGADVNYESGDGHSFLSILESGHHPFNFSFFMKHLDKFHKKNQIRLKKLRLKNLVERGNLDA